MQKFYTSGMFDMCRVSCRWAIEHKSTHTEMPSEHRKEQIAALNSYLDDLQDIGLSASSATIRKIIEELKKDGCKWSGVSLLASEPVGRLVDETGDKVFFSLTLRESEFFNNCKRGWEKAVVRFPAVVTDVEEASKCFALSRYASSVFHSVQIVEAGLIALGGFLRVKDPNSGWTAVSQALKKVIDKSHKDRTLFERRNFKFLEQMQGTVEGLKNAWRNKISHTQGRLVLMTTDFSPDVAEEILLATRAFMRRLAEDLPPPKPKKKAGA
jgi:hypothetical protein